MAGPGSKKVIYAALFGNALIAVTKFFAASVTGSSAMFAEGVHSLVDTGNQGLLLHGMKQAKRPPDDRHPFGYGTELYFWAFVVAILIFAVGAGVSIYEGIHKVIDPHVIENPMINYIVLGLAMVFEGVAWWIAYREFNTQRGKRGVFEAVRDSKDPTVFTVLFEDTAAMLGLIVAFVGIALAQVTGILLFDGLASILIGCILGGTAILLAIETKGLLIGEAAEKDVIEGVREIVQSRASVVKVNELRTMHQGPTDILVAVSIDFRNDLSVGAIEETIYGLEKAIKGRFADVTRVFIEVQSTRHHDEMLEREIAARSD